MWKDVLKSVWCHAGFITASPARVTIFKALFIRGYGMPQAGIRYDTIKNALYQQFRFFFFLKISLGTF